MMIAHVYQNLVQILVGLINNEADVMGRLMNVTMKVLRLPTYAKFWMLKKTAVKFTEYSENK